MKAILLPFSLLLVSSLAHADFSDSNLIKLNDFLSGISGTYPNVHGSYTQDSRLVDSCTELQLIVDFDKERKILGVSASSSPSDAWARAQGGRLTVSAMLQEGSGRPAFDQGALESWQTSNLQINELTSTSVSVSSRTEVDISGMTNRDRADNYKLTVVKSSEGRFQKITMSDDNTLWTPWLSQLLWGATDTVRYSNSVDCEVMSTGD
jgi:hypothetical protein